MVQEVIQSGLFKTVKHCDPSGNNNWAEVCVHQDGEMLSLDIYQQD